MSLFRPLRAFYVMVGRWLKGSTIFARPVRPYESRWRNGSTPDCESEGPGSIPGRSIRPTTCQRIKDMVYRFQIRSLAGSTQSPIPGKTIGLAFFVPGMCTFLGEDFQKKISLGYVSFLVPQTFYIMVGRWLVLQTLCGSDGLTRADGVKGARKDANLKVRVRFPVGPFAPPP